MSNVMSNTEVIKLTQELSERVTRVEGRVDNLDDKIERVEGRVDDVSNQFSTAMNEITKLCVNVNNLVNKMDEHITEDKDDKQKTREDISELQKDNIKQDLNLERKINKATMWAISKLLLILGALGTFIWGIVEIFLK